MKWGIEKYFFPQPIRGVGNVVWFPSGSPGQSSGRK